MKAPARHRRPTTRSRTVAKGAAVRTRTATVPTSRQTLATRATRQGIVRRHTTRAAALERGDLSAQDGMARCRVTVRPEIAKRDRGGDVFLPYARARKM